VWEGNQTIRKLGIRSFDATHVVEENSEEEPLPLIAASLYGSPTGPSGSGSGRQNVHRWPASTVFQSSKKLTIYKGLKVDFCTENFRNVVNQPNTEGA
jgi:hypothetical protein